MVHTGGLGRAVGTRLLEFLPAMVVAVVLLPWIIRNGTFIPWAPQTTDLEVYVFAVRDLLAGKDIYQTKTSIELWFIYPPVAAILMIPLAIGPYLMWQVLWTGLLIAAQNTVLARIGVRRGWVLALVSVCAVIAVEPIRTTLGYGQVNTFLMLLVVADLVPDRSGRKRLIPQGMLIGLAAAIKLTPLLFVVFLVLMGRRRAAVISVATFVVLTVIGAAVMWQGTVAFFGGLLGGDTRTSGPQYVGNQSMVGVTTRLLGMSTPATLLGLAIAGVVALLAVLVATHWWRRGEHGFAVSLVGIATCVASPLSWTHHWVWVLPLSVAALLSQQLPRWVVVVASSLGAWAALQLPLSVLPYHSGASDSYTALQQVVANLCPSLASLLVVGLAVSLGRAHDQAPRLLRQASKS